MVAAKEHCYIAFQCGNVNISVLSCIAETKEQADTEPEVPIKRKRGRPPKNKAVTENVQEIKDARASVVHVDESSEVKQVINEELDTASGTFGHEETADNLDDENDLPIADDKEDLGSKENTVDENIDNDDEDVEMEIVSPKKRGASRMIEENEEDVVRPTDTGRIDLAGGGASGNRRTSVGRGRRKGEKALNQQRIMDAEAQKIKAMADAMKTKIEDNKMKDVDKGSLLKKNVVSQGHPMQPSDVKTEPNRRNINPQCSQTKLSEQNPRRDPSRTVEEFAKSGGHVHNRPDTEKECLHTKTEVQFGIDSILQNSSGYRPRADVNKGSIIGNFIILAA